MPQTEPRRGLSAIARLKIRHVHPVGHRVEQGDLDRAALVRFIPRQERLKNRRIGVLAGRDITHGYPDPCAALRRAVDREEPALALNEHVVRLLVAIWA